MNLPWISLSDFKHKNHFSMHVCCQTARKSAAAAADCDVVVVVRVWRAAGVEMSRAAATGNRADCVY